MDIMLMLIFIVLWGMTFPQPVSGINKFEVNIQKYFPFILNAPLAALTVVSSNRIRGVE